MPGSLNLQSMRLGINSIVALANVISQRTIQESKYHRKGKMDAMFKDIERLNLSDNSVSDYGMHALKTILDSTDMKSLSIASNMISGEGIELILEDLIKNKTLKHLDLGILEGSMKKNSLGIQGAVCISALLIKNKVLESLCINDNDFGPDGGECIGIALSQNDNLRVLKISENDLKSEGAIPIIKSAINLQTLSLAKNFMKADVGKPLAKLLKYSDNLLKLSIEFNELGVQGCKWIAKGLAQNHCLESLNIKGNLIGDEGMVLLAESLKEAPTLTHLDVSLNEIGPQGFQALSQVLPETNINNLGCSKNFLGDDVMALFANILADSSQQSCQLTKFDFSSCRMNDSGLIFLINALQNNKNVRSVKLSDNFYSENVEAVLLETLNKNVSLTEINFSGNRFSHSCLQKVKRITTRN